MVDMQPNASLPDEAPLAEPPLEEPPLPGAPTPTAPAPANAQAPTSPAAAPPAPPQGGGLAYPPGYQPSAFERAIDAADSYIGAIPRAWGAGAARSVFETKDFLTGGETPESQRSSIRQQADATVQNGGTALGLVSGIAQFSTGMLGLGKLKLAAPAKAAAVGAIAFDPHEGNLANIVQSVPALQNPVTQFLSVKEGDPEALARAKNAMLSIGVDVAATTLFTKALTLYKSMKGGADATTVEAAHADLTDEHSRYNAPPTAANENEGLAPGKAATNDNTPNPSMPIPSLTPAEQAEYNLKWAAREADARDAARAARDLQGSRDAFAADLPKPANDAAEAGYRLDTNDNYPNPLMPTPQEGQGPVQSVPSGKVRSQVQFETPTEAPAPTEVPSQPEVPGEPAKVRTSLQYQVGEQPKPGETPNGTQLNATGIPADVRMVDSAAQGSGGGGRKQPNLVIPEAGDEQIQALLDTARKDTAALAEHGTWENAVDAGHVFGDGVNIPWQKLAESGKPSSAVDAYISRVADILKSQMDAAKGGAVIGDAKNDAMVMQRANLWNQDPAQLLGVLQAAGKDSIHLRANMDASYLVASRVMQDAYTLAARINAGYLDEFGGSREAAMDAFRKTTELASMVYSQANSMRANVGRAMRGLRSEFSVSQQDVELLRNADPEVMLKIMGDTGGNPQALVQALKPGLWEPGGLAYAAKQFGSWAQYLLINNLVSNPLTHVVIGATNLYQVTTRPMERLIGSWVQRAAGLEAGTNGEAARIGQAALQQYTYMSGVLHDSFQEAVKAFNAGDAIMAPHQTEVISPEQLGIGQTVAQMPFKPFDSVPNVLSNVLIAAAKTLGLPTRFVGAQDEIVKQIVYRSKVLADAHVEGIQEGLEGGVLKQHVQQRLADSFDGAGRATSLTLLQEAKMATYQQDLLDGTFGKAVNNFRNYFPALKVILPFVPTPVNLFRNGVKLTPGLNLVQTEYRQMLSGAMGAEQQAQAIGQMALGSLAMGTMATLAYEGRVTGGGPSDPKLRKELSNTGWRPYSFALPQSDGTIKYVPFGRFDPVAMPMGMTADIMDVVTHPDPVISSKAKPMMEALATGMLKSLTDKLYLQNLVHTIEAISEPDANMWKVSGGIAAEYVPLSSALKAGNPDPYMREARDFVDRAKMGIPGFSEDLPAKYDAFGEPVHVHKGLWLTDAGSQVDHEMNRMALEQGVTIGPPPPTGKGGADLRQLKMADGSDAYEKYQQLSRQPAPGVPPMKDAVANLINSDTYRNQLVDGDAATKGTRLNAILQVMSKYRSAAERIVSADPNVSAAQYKKQMDAINAMSAKSVNPTVANRTSDMMTKLGSSFGVDLHSLAGATGANPPAPLPQGSQVIQ